MVSEGASAIDDEVVATYRGVPPWCARAFCGWPAGSSGPERSGW